MDTNDKNPPTRAVTLVQLNARPGEFEVPDGAIAALEAGADTPVVILRSTGETYRLMPEEGVLPPAPQP